MCFPLGKLWTVENARVDSNTPSESPACFASIAAAIPATPPPMIARSNTSGSFPRCEAKSLSIKIACTAFVPVSAANFNSGTRMRSPTIRTPRMLVAPASPASGSGSTVPAGNRV